jgi:hypothetical protein
MFIRCLFFREIAPDAKARSSNKPLRQDPSHQVDNFLVDTLFSGSLP